LSGEETYVFENDEFVVYLIDRGEDVTINISEK